MKEKNINPTLAAPIKTKKTEDSLTLLIKSEFFDAHMLFYYLFYNTRQGVQDMLINKLYTIPSDIVEFYINQIWFS